ncbi:hypothetical protein VaNZ11_009670, partial [Volvox africanus]
AGAAAAAAAGLMDITSSQLRDTPPLPPQAPQCTGPPFQNGLLTTASSWRNSEPGIVPIEGAVIAEQGGTPARTRYGVSAFANAVTLTAAAAPGPSGKSQKRWSGRFLSGHLSLAAAAPAATAREVDAAVTVTAPAATAAPQTAGAGDSGGDGDTSDMRSVRLSPLIPTAAATTASAAMLDRTRTSLPGCNGPVPQQPATPVPETATQTGIASVRMLPGGGGSSGVNSGAGGTAPGVPSAAGYISRNRAISIWRGRLAALVDDILSGESNILAGLPTVEAAAVKSSVVTLLALRNQHATVLSMPGLQPCPRSAVADAGRAGGCSASAGPASIRSASTAAEAISDSSYGPPLAVGAAVEALVAAAKDSSPTPLAPAPHPDNGASGALRASIGQAGQGQEKPAAAPPDGPEAAKAATTVIGPAESEMAANRMSSGGGGNSGGATATPAAAANLVNGPTGLAALMQAAGSDPNCLAETRTAVCALLLLTWSELIHVKDPATALSLLQCRASDVRMWASRLAANVSGRRRTVSLLGAMDYGVDDIQNLLLLEVPRMQLEVIPLWQRTVELLPGLQPQLDALQANRATYVSMLQDTGSLAATSSYGGVGATAIATATATGGASGTTLAQRGSAGSTATGSGTGAPSGFAKVLGPRSTANADRAASVREPPRRFISVKSRGALARSILTVLPSGDSGSSSTAAGGGGGDGGNAGTRGRLFMRASSSRSYGGRNEADDFDPDFMGPGGGSSAAADAAANGSRAKVRYQGTLANANNAAGSRSLRRAASRSGGPPPTLSSRLASLALMPSGHSSAFVATAATGTAVNGIENMCCGTSSGGAGTARQCTRGSNQSFAGQVSSQVLAVRPRSQTNDLGTSPQEAAATAGTASPTDISGDQRRTSITRRLNNLFISFRTSGRSSQRPLMPGTDAASGGTGGSSHANAAVVSSITGGPGSPPPPPFSGNSPFEVYGYGYSTHDGGGGGGGLVSQSSQLTSLNLVTAMSAAVPTSVGTAATGSAPLSQALSQTLRGTAGGCGEARFVSSESASPVRLPQISQVRAALPTMPSSRRPTAPATLAIAVAGPESLRTSPGEGSAVSMPPVPSTERGAFGFPGSKLGASIMRRLSHVAARLPFHNHHTVIAAGSNAGGRGSSSSSGAVAGGTSWAGAADAAAPAPTDMVAVPSVSVGLPPGTEAAVGLTLTESTSCVLPLTNASYGGRQRDQVQDFCSVPLPTACGGPPLLHGTSLFRSGTIQSEDRAQRQSQSQLHESRLSHAQLLGGPPPPPLARPRRVTAPSGALALAQQHEQYAATVAAAAVAFAAKQAEANQADAATDGADGADGDVEDGMPSRNTVSVISLTGGLMGAGILSTVAELTGSGQNSSATCTARSNSTAAPGTPKHVATPHTLTSPGVTAGAASSGGGGIGPPSRFAPVLAYEMASGAGAGPGPAATAVALPPPTSTPPPSARMPTMPTRHSHVFEASDNITVTTATTTTTPPVGGTAPTVTAQGRGGESSSAVDYSDPRARGPIHRASSKGVWLGLRLATDALRSVGRRADRTSYSASSSGALTLEPGISSQHTEAPRMLGVFPNPSAPHRTSVHLGPASTASLPVGGAGGAGVALAASGSWNPSRLQTPAASLRRGGIGTGGVASLQAVIDMAEAALAGGYTSLPLPPYSSSRFEHVSVGVVGPGGGPSRNQSKPCAFAMVTGQAG